MEHSYKLSNLFGLNIENNYNISCSNLNGISAFISGTYAVLVDISNKIPISYIQNKNNKVISSIAFNSQGNILCLGEGKTKNCEISFYLIEATNQPKLLFSFKAHKYSIEKIKFFKEDDLLISIGDNEDKIINVWDVNFVKNDIIDKDFCPFNIFSTKYKTPIIAFDINYPYLLFGGDKFLKLWTLDYKPNLLKLDIIKNNIDCGKLKDKVFTDTFISISNKKCKIFAVSQDSYLLEVNIVDKMIGKWMHLKANECFSLSTNDELIFCGCSDGILRIFDLNTLNHIISLPKQNSLNSLYLSNSNILTTSIYSDVISITYNRIFNKLIIIYSNKQVNIWTLKEKNENFTNDYSLLISGSLNSIDYNNKKKELITASNDYTLQYWSITSCDNDFLFNIKNNKKIIYYEKDLLSKTEIFNSNKIISFKQFKYNKEIIDVEEYFTTIKLIRHLNFILCGSNTGCLYIYCLTTGILKFSTLSHNSSIELFEDYYKENNSNQLFCSGSSDCFVHVYDLNILKKNKIEENELLITSLEQDSKIVSVIFYDKPINQLDKDNLYIIVSTSNSKIILYKLMNNSKKVYIINTYSSNDTNSLTFCSIYLKSVDMIYSGENGKISVYDIKTFSLEKTFEIRKGNKKLDNLILATDESDTFLASFCNDNYIRIRNSHNGELYLKIQTAESVTYLNYTNSYKELIYSSIEGQVYFIDLKILKQPENPQNKSLINLKKLNILENYIKENNKLSGNTDVLSILNKIKCQEELKIDDIKLLESLNLGNIIENNDIIKDKLDIILKEEQILSDNIEDNENERMYMTKSKIYEKQKRESLKKEDNFMNKNSLTTSFIMKVKDEMLLNELNEKVKEPIIKITKIDKELQEDNERNDIIKDSLSDIKEHSVENNSTQLIENTNNKINIDKEKEEDNLNNIIDEISTLPERDIELLKTRHTLETIEEKREESYLVDTIKMNEIQMIVGNLNNNINDRFFQINNKQQKQILINNVEVKKEEKIEKQNQQENSSIEDKEKNINLNKLNNILDCFLDNQHELDKIKSDNIVKDKLMKLTSMLLPTTNDMNILLKIYSERLLSEINHKQN